MHLKDRIRELRKSLKMTLKEFGDKIHLSLSAVSSIELGKVEITERVVSSILAAFPQVNADWLREGKGDMYQPQSDKDQIMSMLGDLELPEITERFAVAYTSLSEQEQHIVNNYIRSVIADLVAKYHKEEAIHEDAEPSYEERKRILVQELDDEEATGGKSSASMGGEGTTA